MSDELSTSTESLIVEQPKRAKKRKFQGFNSLKEIIDHLAEREEDPKVELFFSEETTQAQRNIVFQAIMYFVEQAPHARSDYKTIVAGLNNDFILATNQTRESPMAVRIASGKQIGNFISFLEAYKVVIWGNAPVSIRLWCRIEGSDFFPLRY